MFLYKLKHFSYTSVDNSTSRNWDGSVSIEMGCRLIGWGSIHGREKRLFSAQQHSNQAFGPTQPHVNGYWGGPKGQSGQFMEISCDPHLVLKSRMAEIYFHSPIHHHGLGLN
jgi:hypothetical protein